MEKDDLRLLARKAAEEPFRIRMTGGEVFDIRHPELMVVGDYHGAVMVVQEGRERMHLFTLVKISTIEMLPTPETAPPSENGKGD